MEKSANTYTEEIQESLDNGTHKHHNYKKYIRKKIYKTFWGFNWKEKGNSYQQDTHINNKVEEAGKGMKLKKWQGAEDICQELIRYVSSKLLEML